MKYVIMTWAIILAVKSIWTQSNPNPDSSVDNYIQNEMLSEKLPGVSTVIVKNGEIIWIESYGYADLENNIPVEDTTVFLLASVSKLFTGTAIMKLYESGLITLDEDINNHLQWPIDIPGFSSDSITFRRLMTHTASIDDNGSVMDTYYDYPDPSISLADCIQRYFSTNGSDYDPNNNFLNSAPGSTYNYSNMGTALNGYLVEALTGNSFDEFCNQNIFYPLCMNKTSWFISDFDTTHIARPYSYSGGNYIPYPHYGFADYPDGQLRTNAFDIANFMIAFLNGGNFGSYSILSQNSISEMLSVQYPGIDLYQGLNWYKEEIFHSNGSSWLWGHNGGEKGVSTDLYLDPNTQIGICVLSNGEGDAINICDELYEYALGLNSPNSFSPCDNVSTVTYPEANFSIFPNPSMERVTVVSDHHGIVKIFDVNGSLVLSKRIPDGNTDISLDSFLPGVYLFEFAGVNQKIRRKVIIE